MGSGTITSFVIAALFLALAIWVGVSGSVWAVGLGAMAVVWIVLGVRALRRR